MNLVKYTNNLIKVTTPIVLPILKANKSRLFLLLLLSILLGFIPSIKSGIESNFLNESNNLINSNDSGKVTNLNGIFGHVFREQSTSDFLENLPNYFTNGKPMLLVVVIYIIAIIITFIFEFFAEKVKTQLSKSIFVSIREAAFKKALNTNPEDLPKMSNAAGKFSSSIQIGTANISNVYNFLADTFQYIFLLITSLLVLFAKAWLFGIVFIVTLILQVLLSNRRANKLKADREELEKQRNNLIGQTEDIISKKEIILAFEQEDKYNSKITELSTEYGELSRSLDLRGFLYSNISKLINETERFLIPLIALIFIVYFDRQAITSVGGIFFLITLYSRLAAPILSILSQYDALKENEATSNSLLKLLEIVDDGKASTQKDKNAGDSAVTFDNVSFSYNDDKPILNKCSFIIPKNKTTIILGPSGCGKSSIAKIILGFWSIDSGIVSLMGQQITSYSDKEIRLFTSYISQGDYIIDDTIRDNLNWGNVGQKISDEMMLEALGKVRLISSLKDTHILDKLAKDLSGGEQQRLSLARIIIDNAPLLILDEPLTGVDVYTIKDIMPVFKNLLEHQNRTVILISHKLSFTNSADYLILLNKEGDIIEQGNPKELVHDSTTTFYNLYQAALQELTVK